MKLPPEILDALEGRPLFPVTDDHRSGDLVYRAGEDYILKIASQPDRLKRERAANDFLQGKLAASHTVAYAEAEGRGYYLKTRVPGRQLTDPWFLSRPRELTECLAKAMLLYHSVQAEGCPLKNPDSQGTVFIHGDFCLPNILVQESGVPAFIDTQASGLGDPWMDYGWAIWSLEYNLRSKEWTPLLLRLLQIDFDREKYQQYVVHSL